MIIMTTTELLAAVATRPLTPKQRELLEFLYAKVCDRGIQPTNQEMADHFGVKAPAIQQRLTVLARKGYIHLAGAKSRSIRLLAWPDGAPFRGLARREG